MNAHTEIKDIAAIIETNPVSVLVDDMLYSRLIEHMKTEVAAFVPDLSTATSRKEIASLAYKVTRTKTAIDNAGKKLNEDARAKINAVDAKRRIVRDELDALAEQARKPLNDWEAQEDARIEYCMSILKAIEDCGNGLIGGESAPFGLILHELEQKIVINAELAEFEEQARVAHKIALDKVRAAFEAHQKAEADRIELEKLRAEKAQREEADRLAAEAAERERLEKDRQQKAEAEYKVNVARAAEEARQAEIAKAKAEQERVEREAAAKVAAAEAEAKAAREKAEREERERQAAIQREKDEREARERDRDHRGKVMGEVKAALMAQGAGESTAKKIVLAIIAGEIPHCRMEF